MIETLVQILIGLCTVWIAGLILIFAVTEVLTLMKLALNKITRRN